MKNPFKVPESNLVCHKILGFLLSQSNGLTYNSVSSNEMSGLTRISTGEIILYHTILKVNNDIQCEYLDEEIIMRITDIGKNSFIKRKFIVDGRKERIEGADLYFRTISPYLTIIISIIALIKSFWD